jgi:hypothetical protein
MPAAEFLGLGAQGLVGELRNGDFKRVDAGDGLQVLLDQPIVAAAENLLEKAGYHSFTILKPASAKANACASGRYAETKTGYHFFNQKPGSGRANARASGPYAGTETGDHGLLGRKLAGKSEGEF